VVLITANIGTLVLAPGTLVSGNVVIGGAAAGIFGSHNCKVLPSGSDKISGLGTLLLSSDFAAVTLYALPTGGYLVVS
jgi:hypothetical protein